LSHHPTVHCPRRIKLKHDERCRLEREQAPPVDGPAATPGSSFVYTEETVVESMSASMSDEEEEEEDVGVGFFNDDGNSCYLNCTLQCLVHTTALTCLVQN
jgi:ubiquitin C-terminal hydrolase